MAEELDYVPMPDNVVKLVAEDVDRNQGRRRQALSRDELESRLLHEYGRCTAGLYRIFEDG